jgi:hypothetical protein
MKRPHKNYALALLTAAALALGACANQMEPAQQALANIDTAVAATSAAAAKYVPDQYKDLQAKVASLHASFDNKDYAAVLAGAPPVLDQARGIGAGATLKKEELDAKLTSGWAALTASLPAQVSAVQAKLSSLGKMSKPPQGIDVAAAKAAFGDAPAEWKQATAAFAAGNIEDASAAAKDVSGKVSAAAAALMMKLPMTPVAAAAAPASH